MKYLFVVFLNFLFNEIICSFDRQLGSNSTQSVSGAVSRNIFNIYF